MNAVNDDVRQTTYENPVLGSKSGGVSSKSCIVLCIGIARLSYSLVAAIIIVSFRVGK